MRRASVLGVLAGAALALAGVGGGTALGAQARPGVTLPTPVLAAAPVDTGPRLAFDDFYRQVLVAHPVARQAGLVRDQAREELRVARGGFDPTVTALWDRKVSGGAQYFDYLDAELKVPTPIGTDVKLAYERSVGTRIAADRYTGSPTGNPGILKLGFSIPVGQRLLTDERRVALAQARALQDVAEADRRAALNKLLLSAAKDYARWYESDRRRAVAIEGVTLAEFRLRAVRERVTRGEAAAIDTVEARLEVQRRQVQRLEAEQAYYAVTLDVANYLWDRRGQPLEVASGARPSLAGLAGAGVDSTQLPRWLELAARQHPDLRKVQGRVEQAGAQRLFALQQVIPFAEASLSSVSQRGEFNSLVQGDRFGENSVVGAQLRTPLLFMRERGRFNLASQRLEVQEIEEARVRREVELEVRAAVFELSTVGEILALQREAVRQARQLLAGEQRRFENGETQLLVVNLRERAVLEEELKLASLEAKNVSARATLAVAIGEPATLPRGADGTR
jgi:outer membrane protein TolC